MTIYLTGDTHGDPMERFSFNKNKKMKDLTADDVVFILGDFGVIWHKDEPTNQEIYIMEWLENKPWTTIAITGNHENYDRILEMPITTIFGGEVRETGFDGVYIVPDPTIFDIDGQHILCLPRADSHDIYKCSPEADYYHLGTGYSNLIDTNTEEGRRARTAMNRNGIWYRVIGESWWPQEKIPVEEYMNYIEQFEDEHFDLILSHEAPGGINKWFGGSFGRCKSNEGQSYFDMLASTLNYDAWFHGHFHFDGVWPSSSEDWLYAPYEKKMCGLYHDIVQV